DKKTYAPTAVKVMDKDKQVQIEVAFTELQINPTFDKNDFHKKEILEDKASESSVADMQVDGGLAVMLPLETLGADLEEKEEVTTDNGERIIMTFKGDKNFTLIQERKETQQASTNVQTVSGDLVNLGGNIGAVSDQTVEWSYGGTDFVLASEEMTIEELITVASSVEGKETK